MLWPDRNRPVLILHSVTKTDTLNVLIIKCFDFLRKHLKAINDKRIQMKSHLIIYFLEICIMYYY